MQRITDTNHIFTGSEPKFNNHVLSKLLLIQTLNWYSQNKTSKDAEKYAVDFFKKTHKFEANDFLRSQCATFGYCCRIVTNGGILEGHSKEWFDATVKQVLDSRKRTKKQTVQQTPTTTVNIQDRIQEKASEIIADLEGLLDDYILSEFKTTPSPFSVMQDRAKGVHVTKISEHFKKRRTQFDDALNTTDKYVKEAYSCFGKNDLKKIIAFFDQILIDCRKITDDVKSTRKPRKRKQKTPQQIVSKLKYLKEFEELNLKSVDPAQIVGCSQLWVYNVKYKKLGCYIANDSDGLSVKGCTILNYNQDKSVQKNLRKPKDVLTQVLSSGKITLRNLLSSIKSVENKLNGRVNEETIILRIIK